MPGPLRLRAAMTESPFPEHSLHCPHKRATHFSEPLVVMPKAIRAVQLPGPGFFQDSEEGFFLPMDKRARFPAPNTCSFLRRKKHILMSSLSALPGSLQPGPTCLAGSSRAPWHAPHPHWSCALEGLRVPSGGAGSTPVCPGGGRSLAPWAPVWCRSLAAMMISQLFIVITLITLNSLGINEDVMCTWMGIFIVVQH